MSEILFHNYDKYEKRKLNFFKKKSFRLVRTVWNRPRRLVPGNTLQYNLKKRKKAELFEVSNVTDIRNWYFMTKYT